VSRMPPIAALSSLLLLAGCGAQDANETFGVDATGGAATGGSPAGGAAVGGAESGGAAAGGAVAGGAVAGGGATGGAGRGGAAPGGSATGGAAIGGAAAGGGGGDGDGGFSEGGSSSGGALAGGAQTGGALAGGAETGGAETGGVETGGAATGGMSTAGGGGAGTGGAGGASGSFELDCGPIGWAVEAHGPPANRVNYVIIGDGYTAADLVAGGTFEQHIARAMNKRFSVPIGEVYSRYRRFVNICALKLESSGSICGGSPLGCCGDDQSRLAECDNREVNAALAANLPESFVVDWRAVVLNGSSWWNTGSATMLWSGGHPDAGGAALHEGGHGFHQLADEYTGSGSGCTQEYAEVNSTADPTTTAGKWDRWLGYDQAGATGLQTTIEGSRYCTAGQYRPSDNSMMNMLFGDDPNTSFNSVSREQMIFTIWRAVEPVDEAIPPAGAVSSPGTLTVRVIDPAVIDVDWSVDGALVVARGGESFDVGAQGLAAGAHTVTARAYDNAGDDLVRYRDRTCPEAVTSHYCARTAWSRSEQIVTWTVTVP